MDLSVFVSPLVVSVVLVTVVLILAVFLLIVLKSKCEEVKALWPYRSKRYFFSRSEQEFLKRLNEAIDNQRFMIFPKVRLADFIEVTVSGDEYQSWWNKIRSKHIDFLIWDLELSKIALAIELDGKSHDSEKMVARDEFVGKLYETVGMRLERVRVGENFEKVCSEMSQYIITRKE